MRAIAFLFAATAVFAQSQPQVTNAQFTAVPLSGNLATHIRSDSPSWFGYAVKSVDRGHDNCCWRDGTMGCNLEGSSSPVMAGTLPNLPVQLEAPANIAVLFRVAGNRVEKIRVYSTACPLDAGGLPFTWLTNVPAGASLTFLKTLVTADAPDRVMDSSILAIALHDDPGADTSLEELTRPSQLEKVREKAVFWLGAARGAKGVSILTGLVAHDPSERVRDKAVFALFVSKRPEALEPLVSAAKNDPSPHVRGQALFWLAQKAGKRATETITAAVKDDADTAVKKRAVFALSQLPKDEGVPRLIEVARNQTNPVVRKQAFFWLGQSKDPRALAFFEQVLTQ